MGRKLMSKLEQAKLQTHATFMNGISVAFFAVGYIGVAASIFSGAITPLFSIWGVLLFSVSSIVISILGHLFACQLAMRAALEAE